MLNSLSPDDYDKVIPLFRGFPHHLITTAVIERSSPGEIYVDRVASPRAAFMISPEGYFLAGSSQDRSFNAGLKHLVAEKILPQRMDLEGDPGLDLHYVPHSWADHFPQVFDIEHPLIFEARYYSFKQHRIDWRSRLPVGFHLHPVDGELLARTGLQNRDGVMAKIEKNWGSIACFLAKGFGFCLVHGDIIVSECLADCVSARRCEIGISTDERYRRRGFAALTVAATVDHCVAQGFTHIGWHCASSNLGSIRTAETVGFELRASYPIYWLCLDPMRNLLANGAYNVFRERWHHAISFFEEAFDLRGLPTAYEYDAAVARAMVGDTERALDHLWRAAQGGWTDPARLMADPRLDALRAMPGWQDLLAHLSSSVPEAQDRTPSLGQS
jgi:RimJ/RimL family protein N-acetyltransferase